MLANLQIFVGSSAINGYGDGLRKLPALLWGARGGLILIVLLHIFSAARLTRKNRAARPRGYAFTDYRAAGYASRTMVLSGLILFAFIAFHLAHYTLLWVDTGFQSFTDDMGRHDIYRMVVVGFSNYWVSALYVIAVGLLCSHLSHGIPSFFQSLGLRHPKYTPGVTASGPVIAVLIFAGFISVPIAVMAKWVTLAGGAS
jgi:succinate dehydrogenase / fumarate reductase cytochrome b subunit